jgi:CubicO group peptidase (beta-lactamase class C family)
MAMRLQQALFSLISLIAVASAAVPATAAEPIAARGLKDREAAKAARTAVAKAMAEDAIPALSVAVWRGDKLVWVEAFGTADLESSAKATPASKFRLGSVSKVLTAALAGRMVDAGLVDLDRDIREYLPSFPDKDAKITLRQLLGHQAGVRHYEQKDQVLDLKRHPTTADALAIFAEDPLIGPPGAQYRYSTFGYTLIGAVLEAAGGKGFAALLAEHVTAPLGLAETGMDDYGRIVPGRVDFYSNAKDYQSPPPAEWGAAVNANYENTDYKRPGGGMLSTPADLATFGAAFIAPGFLSEETYRQTFTLQKTADGKETIVGLGWRIGADAKGRRIYHHAGNQSGARAGLVVYPDQKIAVAVLSNMSNRPGPIVELGGEIADGFIR